MTPFCVFGICNSGKETQELGDAFRPKLQLLNDQDLKNEKQHRNDIAHYKVDALDWEMLRSLQKKVFGILKATPVKHIP